MENQTNPDNHVAIIGMACRLPGAADIGQFWSNLLGALESLTTFDDQELIAAGVSAEQVHAPNYVKSRGIIGGADQFDAGFFGFTPREAELLDPQHRVFLECAWHAMEDAGYDAEQCKERIGVFGGVGTNWHLGEVDRHPDVKKYASGASVVTSNDKDYLTTRVSYKLNLTGPSVNVQCACSTSMVATVMGINSLLSHQCDMVLAGGATVEIPETKGYLYHEGGMESPDGHCRPFDANAKDTVFSRGAGVVLLKRLDDALRDNDHIYAVILDGAVNNDGSLKVGFTAPSVDGQVEVAVEAMERAGISPDTLSFVEAHGTATAMGDPIEVASLSQAFRHYTERKQFCALGSVKGNIGHTDVASGMASLIKVALSLKHGVLPASINYSAPNPKIDFDASPFFVNTAARELSRRDGPLRALINSFGVGGTNACAILQEPPVVARQKNGRVANLLLLSAKTDGALDTLTSNFKQYVAGQAGLDLNDAAFTLQVGRRHFKHRRFIAYQDRADLLAKLGRPGVEGMNHSLAGAGERPIVFAFPGQGNQFVGMGHDLYQSEPVFRAQIDLCCEYLLPVLGLDLRDVMYGRGAFADNAAAHLNQTYLTQPALFVTSYAMARLWISLGIVPDAMIGHSVGEYVAAALGGVFGLESALHAVASRGKLIQALPGGAMLAVLLPENTVRSRLPEALCVAAVNNPQLTIVAGPGESIAAFEEKLLREKIFAKRLDTSHAFHSAMMDAALPPFARTLASMRLNPSSIPIISTVSAAELSPQQATDPDYWVHHVRRTVRFSDAIVPLLAADKPAIFLECGPGHSLVSAIKQHLPAQHPHSVIASMGAATDAGALMEAIGALWAAGRPLDWDAFYGAPRPGRVSLPGYPFERQKYALDFSKSRKLAAPARDEGKKADVGAWFYSPSWQRCAPATARPQAVALEAPICWLLFEDGVGVARAIEQALRLAGDEVVLVRPGPAFSQADAQHFTLRPEAQADYMELLGALKHAGHCPNRVLHLWNIDAGDHPVAPAWADRAATLAFYSPLFLQQALIAHHALADLRFIVAANGVLDIAGEGVQHPMKALAIGPCRVIGKEAPALRARFVDIQVPLDGAGLAALAVQLIDEASTLADEAVAAYRGRYRWTETFEPVRLEAAPQGLRDKLRADGTYLITGGTSGLGLFFAGAIAASATRVKLILTYRSSLPKQAEWAEWLALHPENDAVSEKLRGLLALEAQGAELMLAHCDCADPEAMAQLVHDAERRFGKIDGVIHSAGVAGGGIISLKTEAMAEQVLSAKLRGTLVLDQLFSSREIDFMLLFSSLTAILGEAGRVDYCAANSFMDAMALYHQQRHPQRTTAINWGAWGEFGMAARWEEKKAVRPTGQVQHARRTGDGQWLRFVGDQGEQEIYDVLLDPASDWVIREHLVFGVPTLVGTAFLELAYRFAESKKPACAPLMENLYFMSLLVFEPDAPRQVRLFVRKHGDKYKFSFKSRLAEQASEGAWQEHFMGEMRLEDGAAPPAVDLPALSERFTGGIDRQPWRLSISNETGTMLEFGARWDNLRETHIGQDEWLAKLALPLQFAADIDNHPLYPALLDLALAAGLKIFGNSPYLPAGYKRMQIFRPFPALLWSHIRLNGAYAEQAETVAFDITILDQDGNVLAAIERYTLKNVALAKPAPGAAAPVRRAGGKAPQESKDILPAEGRDALERILGAPFMPQIIACTSDLQALIDEEKPKSRQAAKVETAAEDKPSGYARPSMSTPYEAPGNEIEKAICEIWQGILGIGQIGVDDNFTELGGNSLLVVQAVANTGDTFQVDLPFDTFYQHPTVRGMAGVVLELLLAMAGETTLEELIASLEE
ncbi:acyl transferase domain-containing protein [Oxalobacteraceae bacterium GrIS 1.11]